jgi:hypothetical protein
VEREIRRMLGAKDAADAVWLQDQLNLRLDVLGC